jgi:hypothetical protein
MIKTKDLIEFWSILNHLQKREVVLSFGLDMIKKYQVERELKTIEFYECSKYDNRNLAGIIINSDEKKLNIYEKPSDYPNIWDNPFTVLHNISHEIGHIYQLRIEDHDVYYDDKSFFVACGEEEDLEIFCEIIAISIIYEYFELYEMKDSLIDEYLFQCFVTSIGNLGKQYEIDLKLLSNSKMDKEFGDIIKKCKKTLIDPYFNK